VRSPGGGDNLFLCSIVALDADTGKYKWHYQTVPGETWDYNSSMDIVLADLKISGKTVKALMHAPKNGFFYVIDRSNGKFISAGQIAKVTWAKGIDAKTGRPIENPDARYPKGDAMVWPSPFGAHNWHAMSFSPKTGLAYIPKVELPARFNDQKMELVDWKSPKFGFDVAVDTGFANDIPRGTGIASLIAWDPVRQKKVWEVPEEGFWNPGTMVTAGDVVFQGRATGEFAAYDARTGKKLWTTFLGSGISAPPITYEVDGKQYVSLLVGWGGAGVGFGGGSDTAKYGWAYGAQTRRLFTFALGGNAPMPKLEPPVFPQPVVPADFKVNDTLADKGRGIYVSHCLMCHGSGAVSGGATPDLRASPIVLDPKMMKAVVNGGARVPLGMPQFKELSDEDLEAIRHFVRRQAAATVDSLKPEKVTKK
jgi:quinohemoprotein ethanol dehydrogenase